MSQSIGILDLIESFAGPIVSLFGAGVSLWAAFFITRVHNRLTVKPFLAVHRYFDQQDWCGLSISNLGNGPALIESMRFGVDSQTFSDWNSVLTHLGLDANDGPIAHRTWRAGDAIAVGDSGFLVKVEPGKTPQQIDSYPSRQAKIQRILDRLRVSVTYKSIYDENQTLVWPRK